MSLFIGLMSGTSADGMDAALVDIDTQGQLRLIDASCWSYPPNVQDYLRTVVLKTEFSVHELLQLDRDIATYATAAVLQLLEQNSLAKEQISALGFHGHTLHHRSQPQGFSWQTGDPNWLAEHTGIRCVADFRRRDIAAGGEGAPLVPAFHAACFPQGSMVLNIGGIANLSILPNADAPVLGFDCGPGNALIDEWCRQNFGVQFDAEGQRARQGQVQEQHLSTWLNHPYFQQHPPKSTGRELFQLNLLEGLNAAAPLDVLATLTEFTARSIAAAVIQHGHLRGELLVCGGGVHNLYLLERLQRLLPQLNVTTTQAHGISPDWLEAMAFAWLAWRTVNGLSGNLPAATGAAGARILGGIFQA